jgi:inner membrane protein
MQDVTHLLFALALAYVLDLPVVYAMVGGLLPDIDLWLAALLPIAHRGIMHTPLFTAFVGAVCYLVSARRTVALALVTGMLSHLYLDSLTPLGIKWLYPAVSNRFTLDIVRAADPAANTAMSLFVILVMVGWRYRREVSAWVGR